MTHGERMLRAAQEAERRAVSSDAKHAYDASDGLLRGKNGVIVNALRPTGEMRVALGGNATKRAVQPAEKPVSHDEDKDSAVYERRLRALSLKGLAAAHHEAMVRTGQFAPLDRQGIAEAQRLRSNPVLEKQHVSAERSQRVAEAVRLKAEAEQLSEDDGLMSDSNVNNDLSEATQTHHATLPDTVGEETIPEPI